MNRRSFIRLHVLPSGFVAAYANLRVHPRLHWLLNNIDIGTYAIPAYRGQPIAGGRLGREVQCSVDPAMASPNPGDPR